MARRRRRSYEKKKPVAVAAIWTSVIGLICFLLALALVFVASAGVDFGKVPGIAGVLIMLISMMSFSVGVKTARNADYDIITRVLGVIVPGIAMMVLLIMYFAGILFG